MALTTTRPPHDSRAKVKSHCALGRAYAAGGKEKRERDRERERQRAAAAFTAIAARTAARCNMPAANRFNKAVRIIDLRCHFIICIYIYITYFSEPIYILYIYILYISGAARCRALGVDGGQILLFFLYILFQRILFKCFQTYVQIISW